jgi:O-acetylhomoserine/O-acetylserine sulfhydrylase-like pyridoxal-dependent enzyme
MIETTAPASPVPDAENELSPGVAAWVERGEALTAAEEARKATMRRARFDTIAVHGIYDMAAAAANSGSIMEPTYLSPAQHYEDADQLEAAAGYLIPAWGYSRVANPTTHFLEQTIALLEGYGFDGETSAVVTGSGMAAVHMATSPFLTVAGAAPGERPNVVASARCYGGTFMLFAERYAVERGIDIRWIGDPLDAGEWAAAIDGQTRFVFGEMPANPTTSVFDIPVVAGLAHEAGLPLIVDGTVATAALLRPLTLGADIVVHSVSKAMAGSGMAISGAIVSRKGIPSRVGPDALREDFATYVKGLPYRDLGPALSPFSATVILADLRTLRTRMDHWSRNAERVAGFLDDHPAVEAVAYPSLASHPGHAIARRDMWLVDGDEQGRPVNRFGSLLSFSVRGGHAAARRVFDRLELVWRATDLGRVKSIATIPAISTHQQQGEAGRSLAAVPEGSIRLSVGGEHPDDLIADLDRALDPEVVR